MSIQDTPELLRLLVLAGIDFIVIGGVAAIAHGASTFTRDLDVLISFDDETLSRLANVLLPLDPRGALDPARRPLPSNPSAFKGFRNLYVATSLGRLGLLGETPLGGHAALATRAVPMNLAGVEVHVLALDDLIAIKRALGRPKDILVATELEAIRARVHTDSGIKRDG